ncbi:hypothetical protein AB0B27_11080 [Micromonospora rifamycinica]|uniref:hypothetical protein n=1 Tax=Micromonospora rifamycinica TaxID=291594 RepID=UPI0033D7BF2C
MIRPGGPCLLCLCGYDPRLVDAELDPGLAAARRAAGHRIDDPAEPTPSVVFLNQIIAWYAVGELLNYVSLWRPPVRYLLVDAAVNGTAAMDADRDPQCLACGPDSPRGSARPPAHRPWPGPPRRQRRTTLPEHRRARTTSRPDIRHPVSRARATTHTTTTPDPRPADAGPRWTQCDLV